MTGADLITLGWREWVGLPDLGIPALKAKVDTGAKTSALHAFELRPYQENGVKRIQFKIHPIQKDTDTVLVCHANIIDERMVTDSGGHRESRFVISSSLTIGPHCWPIEMTLTGRDDMLFRFLLGRSAIRGKAQVDPIKSYLVGKKPKKRKRA